MTPLTRICVPGYDPIDNTNTICVVSIQALNLNTTPYAITTYASKNELVGLLD